MCAACEVGGAGPRPHVAVEYATDPNLNKFVVWCPEQAAPTVFHGTFADARDQAKKLAAKNPNKKFYVLHAMARAFETGPSWVEVGQSPR